MVGSRGGGRGKRDGERVSDGDRVSVWEDEKSSGDGWWGRLHNSVNVLKVSELDT